MATGAISFSLVTTAVATPEHAPATSAASARIREFTRAEPLAVSYSWDTNAQLASKTVGAGAAVSTTYYTFDARHELIGATLPDGTKITYRYQPDGNLQSRTKASPDGSQNTIHFLLDTALPYPQVVAEYDDAGHTIAAYTYGADGELLMRRRAGENTYYQHDGLGSVTMLTDAEGHPTRMYEFDAWGNAVDPSGTDDNPYRYAGEGLDEDLGLIYLRARWYDPIAGRFVSPDPLSGRPLQPVTLNRYLYANGDPVNAVDPSGTETLGDIGASIDIQGILSNFARDQITSYAQNLIFGDDPNSDQPSIWDIFLTSLLGGKDGLAQLVSSLVPISMASQHHSFGSPHEHHTIPVYLCGKDTQEKSEDSGFRPLRDPCCSGQSPAISEFSRSCSQLTP